MNRIKNTILLSFIVVYGMFAQFKNNEELTNAYYQYLITGGEASFIVESGKNVLFESSDEVILKPGFHAEKGSLFIARVNTNSVRGMRATPLERTTSIFKNIKVVAYPNPAKNKVNVRITDVCIDCSIGVLNSQGILLRNRALKNNDRIEIELSGLKKGIYFIVVRQNTKIITTKKLMKL